MEKAGACRGLRLTLQQGMAEDEKLLLAGAVLFRQGRQGRVKAGGGLRVQAQLHGGQALLFPLRRQALPQPLVT